MTFVYSYGNILIVLLQYRLHVKCNDFHIGNLKKMHLLQNINSWAHKNTLAPPLEVLVPSLCIYFVSTICLLECRTATVFHYIIVWHRSWCLYIFLKYDFFIFYFNHVDHGLAGIRHILRLSLSETIGNTSINLFQIHMWKHI